MKRPCSLSRRRISRRPRPSQKKHEGNDHPHGAGRISLCGREPRRGGGARGSIGTKPATEHLPDFNSLPTGPRGETTWAPRENKGEPPVDSLMQVPFKPIDFLSRDVARRPPADGTIVLQSNHQLKPYEKHVPAFLAKWASRGAGSRLAGAAPRAGARLAEGHLRRGQEAGRCGDAGAARSRLRAGQGGR